MTLTTESTRTRKGRTTAKAALLTDRAKGGFTIADIDVAAPQSGEVLVSIKASSLCHSDWNVVQNDRGNPLPSLLGHEFAGVVLEVGPGPSEFSVGDHVVACAVASCGACEKCLQGQRVWCRNPGAAQRSSGEPRITSGGEPVWQIAGLGGFAETTLVHQSQLVRVDERVPFDRASVLGCAVVAGAGAVIRAAEVKPRQNVVIFGAGGVGLNAVQAAALVGARTVIVVDVHEHKLDLAKKFGATHVVNASDVDPVDAVRELTGGFGVDHAFEMTGLGGPLQQAYDALAPNGMAYIVGVHKLGSTFPIRSAEFSRGVGMRAVNMGSTNFKIDVPYFAELYLQGRFNLDDLVGQTITLAEINDGYARMIAGSAAGRTVITFD